MARETKRKRLMTPGPDAPDEVRRSLLTGGALTVAASAAALAQAGSAEAATETEPRDKCSQEYRVTDHIAAYYARARG